MRLTDEALAHANERFTGNTTYNAATGQYDKLTTPYANGALYLPLTTDARDTFRASVAEDGSFLLDLIDGGPWLMVVGGYEVASGADADGPFVPGYGITYFSKVMPGCSSGYETFETRDELLAYLRASLARNGFDAALLDGDDWAEAHRAW